MSDSQFSSKPIKYVGKVVAVSILTTLALLSIVLSFVFNIGVLKQPENAGEAVGEAFAAMFIVIYAIGTAIVGGVLSIPSIPICFAGILKTGKVRWFAISFGILNSVILLAAILRIILLYVAKI